MTQIPASTKMNLQRKWIIILAIESVFCALRVLLGGLSIPVAIFKFSELGILGLVDSGLMLVVGLTGLAGGMIYLILSSPLGRLFYRLDCIFSIALAMLPLMETFSKIPHFSWSDSEFWVAIIPLFGLIVIRCIWAFVVLQAASAVWAFLNPPLEPVSSQEEGSAS